MSEEILAQSVVDAFEKGWEAKRKEIGRGIAPKGTKTRAGLAAALEEIDRLDAIENQECEAEVLSWDYFKPEQVNRYGMSCDLLGPHDEHENSNTGAHWRDSRTPDLPTTEGQL